MVCFIQASFKFHSWSVEEIFILSVKSESRTNSFNAIDLQKQTQQLWIQKVDTDPGRGELL